MQAAVQVMRCGNCGADVTVTSPATLHVTCGHCSALNVRGDVDLRSLGEVALPAPLASNFQVGTEGRFDGRLFVVRGQLQLDHGAGLWNEWAAETDGGWIWIAEAQGETHVYEEAELHGESKLSRSSLPNIGANGEFLADSAKGKRWYAGKRVQLGEHGSWVVAEIGRGRVVACRGEFPIEVEIGERTMYVDLAKGSAGVATLDFTRSKTPELLLGRRLLLEDLGLDASTQPHHRPDRIESASVKCSHCGGSIEVHDPEHSLTLGCVHCGTTLSRASHLDAYAAAEGASEQLRVPAIPIGTRTTLRGDEAQVIGYLRRGVWADGTLWPWDEYLLRTRQGAYRWLVESDGHWVLASPTSLATVQPNGGRVEYAGQTYKHFSGGQATVDTVLGEFYWQVRSGDAVRADDYVHPATGTMVSLELDSLEGAASRSIYLPASEMESAFPGIKLPRVRGVGAIQANPVHARPVWKAFALLILLLTASCVATRVRSANQEVHAATYGPTAATAGEEVVQFSDPFTIERDGANAKVMVRAPDVRQGYLDILGALVNEATGEVITFGTAAQYYSGSSGGESWSEGRRKGSTKLGRVPAGTYRLRIASRGYDAATNLSFTVDVRSDVPGFLWFFLAFVALLAWPIVQSIRAAVFEAARWSKSDHAG